MTRSEIFWILHIFTIPFQALYAAMVLVPLMIIGNVWRWYRTPVSVRRRKEAAEQRRSAAAWDAIEQATRAELLAHGLIDTPENRVRLRSGHRCSGR
jgi:hypothetical protein